MGGEVTGSALERIDPAGLLSALGLVQHGIVIDLSQPLDETIPMGAPGAFTPFSFTWRVTPEGDGRDQHYQYSAETITGTLHVGTHIDGLAHVSAAGRAFGGRDIRAIRTDHGFSELGIETVAPIITRGIVIDVASTHGVEALDDGYSISVEDLALALERDGLAVQAGDAVLVKTGKAREYGTDNAKYQAGQPGVSPEAATWLYERGMAVLGTDTTGTEPLPFPDERNTTHQAMLVERGVHLVENLDLSRVGHGVATVGLFLCLPLRITGATGSWVRPVLVT